MAREFFIKGTNKQYSINELGIVYSNYKRSNSGKKILRRLELAKTKNVKGESHYCVTLRINNAPKCYFINTLMREYFKLTPPDKFHYYDLVHSDGDAKNNNLSNLKWRLRLLKDYKYQPEVFYKNRKIISKRCGDCGVIKKIKQFTLQTPKKSGHLTYRNNCERCRSIHGWNRVKSNPVLFKRYMKRTKEWSKTKDGKKYYSNYRLNWNKEQKSKITKRYAFSLIHGYSLGLSQSDMTNQLYQIIKKRVKLTRLIKNERVS